MRRTLAIALLLVAVSYCNAHRAGLRSEAAEARHGRQLLASYGCGSCHRIPGVRMAHGLVGPPLDSFSQRAFIAGEVPNTEPNLEHWIESPQSIEPGTAMPATGASDADARAMAAYLMTLR